MISDIDMAETQVSGNVLDTDLMSGHVEVRESRRKFDNTEIEVLEGEMLKLEQKEVPLEHMFAPGVYARQVVMPADTFVIGHEHKTEHFNIIMTGKATVMMNGVVHEVQAPAIIKSEAGVRKILYIREEMRWVTIHPTNETNIEKLEDMLVVKSDAFRHNQHLKEIETLQNYLTK